jgi:hypothetical protein
LSQSVRAFQYPLEGCIDSNFGIQNQRRDRKSSNCAHPCRDSLIVRALTYACWPYLSVWPGERLATQVCRACPSFPYLTGCYFYNTARKLTRRAAGVKARSKCPPSNEFLIGLVPLRSFKNSFALRVHGSARTACSKGGSIVEQPVDKRACARNLHEPQPPETDCLIPRPTDNALVGS